MEDPLIAIMGSSDIPCILLRREVLRQGTDTISGQGELTIPMLPNVWIPQSERVLWHQ